MHIKTLKTNVESTVPVKIRTFLWLIAKKTVLIWDKLQCRGWEGFAFCVPCACHEETIDHIMICYHFSQSIWSSCYGVLGLKPDAPAIWNKVFASRYERDTAH